MSDVSKKLPLNCNIKLYFISLKNVTTSAWIFKYTIFLEKFEGRCKFCFFPLDNSLLFQSFILTYFSANFTKWSNKLKQFVGSLPTNCLSMFDHFVRLVLKGLTYFNVAHWTLTIWIFESYLQKRCCMFY